jgi:hypothetical protein
MTQYPATLLSGTNAAVAVGAAVLGASQHCLSITVIAPIGNTDNIFIGDSVAQPLLLAPGNVASLDVNNVDQIFVRSAAGVQTADYLMET